eukprot:c20144_g2_i1 orf=874-2103(+)
MVRSRVDDEVVTTRLSDGGVVITETVAVILICILPEILLPVASSNSGSLGVNYGMIANDLPPPTAVVRLIQSMAITKTRIYSTSSDVLQVFGDTGISFIVGIGNEDVPGLTDPTNATSWLKQHIDLYLPNTQITCIAVGNEIFSGNNTELMRQLLPAMQNLQSALVAVGLEGQVAISTPHSLAILSNSFPPSAGAFESGLTTSYITPLLDFLSETGSPFLVNAYPYFAYKSNPESVSLDYVLFQPNAGILDPITGLRYYNMLDAQLDAVYSALETLGYGNVRLIVSETGWPSAGDPDEAGATIQNAQTYNANLIQRITSNTGTPLRPNLALEAYIFALFNEDLKPGPTSERNYGLFNPDGTRVYDFGLDDIESSSSSVYLISSSLEVCPFLTTYLLCLSVSLINAIRSS